MSKNDPTGRRTSGLLLHPTSLPGPPGSGDLGPCAYQFVRFLRSAGQTWWQMLPVVPPGHWPGLSPYSSGSAFAGSPYLISLELLVRDGLLARADLRGYTKLDLRGALKFRESRLRRAFARFVRARHLDPPFRRFVKTNASWLDDFALFAAIKPRQSNRSWTDWPIELRLRQHDALRDAKRELAVDVRFHQFVQFLFDRQWTALREHCRKNDVKLIGDIPIFVVLDSVDVWANPKLFTLDRAGKPTIVTGCPPDVYARDGQVWGHPQYDWATHRKTRFAWWTERFRSMLHRFDAVRIDHFLGFQRAWAIPAGAKTARKGRWVPGPGEAFSRAVEKSLGRLPVIAEDLGLLTPQAEALRDAMEFPGMRVMQFGFGDDEDSPRYLPHRYPPRSVAYTGTHDNNTTAGWFKSLKGPERQRVMRYLDEIHIGRISWAMIRATMMSSAALTIFPVQDALNLGSEARMNTPGIADGNWRWRLKPSGLTPRLAKRLNELTALTDRAGRRGRSVSVRP